MLGLLAACAPAENDFASESRTSESRAPAVEASIEPPFVEQALELGLDFVHFNGASGQFYFPEVNGGGAALLDYDRDGDLDLYLVQGALIAGADGSIGYDDTLFPPSERPPRDHLYRNDLIETGKLGFTDVTAESGIDSQGYGMGVAVGDVDNDGWPDLYVANWGENQLWRNLGGEQPGQFENVTSTSGTGDSRWSSSVAFADVDQDGWLDLYVTNYLDYTLANHKQCFSTSSAVDYCNPLAFRSVADSLFRNLGSSASGTFEDISVTSRIASEHGAALGILVGDFNDDGKPDLYVANDGSANQLWIGNGNGTFRNDALISGTAFNGDGQPEGSMGVDFADYDGDGDDDLFLTHIRDETNTLYRNDGGLFNDLSTPSGLGIPSRPFTGFGTGFFDYDNDGWLDVFVANGAVSTIDALKAAGDPYPLDEINQLFHNLGPAQPGRFEEITERAGDALALAEVSRAAAFGDLDNDGDADVVIANNSGPVRVLVNQVGHRRSWLGLRLLRQADGRDDEGARVGVTLSDGRTLWRTARRGASYNASNDPRVLVGLGDSATVEAVSVRWSDGLTETFPWSSRPVDQYVTLVRGRSGG